MWPLAFSDTSLETANWLSDFANWALVLSLVIGVVSTFAVVRAGNVKERYWEIDRQRAQEKIASLEDAAAKSNEQARSLEKAVAEANARGEQAKAEAAQLRLDLAREIELNTARGLSVEQYEAIQKLKGQVSEVNLIWAPASEPFWFAKTLETALKQADIKVLTPPAPPNFWNVGNSIYEPGTQAGEGPISRVLVSAGLINGASAKPNFAKNWPSIPLIMIGVKPMVRTHPTYLKSGSWDSDGKFQAGTRDASGKFIPEKN